MQFLEESHFSPLDLNGMELTNCCKFCCQTQVITTPRLFQTSSECNDPAKMLSQTGALVFPVKLDGSTCALKYFAKSGFNEGQDCKDITAAQGHIKPPN